MKISEVLEKALDSFGDDGARWITRHYHQYDPVTRKPIKHCSIGAVEQIVEELYSSESYKDVCKVRNKALEFLLSAIKADNEEYRKDKYDKYSEFGFIADFNDHESTTFFDIKRVFKRAIECAKAHENIGGNNNGRQTS